MRKLTVRDILATLVVAAVEVSFIGYSVRGSMPFVHDPGAWPASALWDACSRSRLVLSEYVDHYNSHRPHRTLQQNPPAGRAHPSAELTGMRIQRRDRLGGLIHEYAQVA